MSHSSRKLSPASTSFYSFVGRKCALAKREKIQNFLLNVVAGVVATFVAKLLALIVGAALTAGTTLSPSPTSAPTPACSPTAHEVELPGLTRIKDPLANLPGLTKLSC